MPDGLPAEIFKAMGSVGIDVMHSLCEKIWNTCKWPDEWCLSIFIPIFKRGSPTNCANYRTIALIPHASKILLRIINERLKIFLLPQISEEQSGFVLGKGTREQILNVPQIIENAQEFNIKMYLCLIDYSKDFDSVKWESLWKILKEMGIPFHLIQLIENLYENNTAKVRINQMESNKFNIKAGVRQVCSLSPILFNIYSEHIMRKVIHGWEGGVLV